MIRQWLEQRRQKKEAVELVGGANIAISRMGALLEKHPGGYMDESWLPLAKPAMKTAFKIAIAAETNPERIEWLKAGWILLADFQPGIGNTPLSSPPMPSKPTPEFMASFGCYTDMTKTVAKEGERLLAEMQEFMTSRQISN